MAIVVCMGERHGNKQQPAGSDGLFYKWLVKPFCDAEMHRVEMSRVDHPGQSNEIAVKLLTVWAVVFAGLSLCWFVKYII